MSFTQLLQSPCTTTIIGKNTAMLDNFFGGEDYSSLICETKTVTSPSNDSVNSFSSQEEQIDEVAKFSLFSDDFLSPTTLKQEFGDVSNQQQNLSFQTVQKPIINNVNSPAPIPPSLLNFATTPITALPNFPVNHSSQQNFNIQQTFLLDSMLKGFSVPPTVMDPKMANAATSPMVNPYAAALFGMMPQLALTNPLFPLMQQQFAQGFPMNPQAAAMPIPTIVKPTTATPTANVESSKAPSTTTPTQLPKQDDSTMEDEVSKLKKQYKKTKIEKKMDEMIGAGASNALANVKAQVAAKTIAKEQTTSQQSEHNISSPSTSASSESSNSPTMSPQPAPNTSSKKAHKRTRSSDDDDKEPLLDEDLELQGLDDSAVKLQRRRIKNRESAQASRERKKLYVHGLEKKVQDLTTKNTELQKSVSSLESENAKLKARIKELETGEISGDAEDEPSLKKRRVSFANPFALSFWNYLMNSFAGSNAGVGEIASVQPVGIVDDQQLHQGAQQSSTFEPFYQTTSKKVVLFIMLFCVAIMVAYPHDKILEAFSQATSPAVASPSVSTEAKESEFTQMRVGGRKLLKTKEGKEQLAEQVRTSFKQFNEELSTLYEKFDFSDEANVTEMVKQSLSDNSQDQLVFQANFDATKQQIVISLKDDKVINLDEDEAEVEAAKKRSGSSTGKFDSQVISISKSLFKSICDSLQ